jgi:hypothetical protein
MHKKKVIVSYLPHRLPHGPARRILLSRETIRTLSSDELSQAAGGNEEAPTRCNTGSAPDV